MAKKKDGGFLMQGAILAATALITKIIGLAYRIPVTNIMGSEGNGYYGIVFQVYNLALMLTSYSLPMAVSKLVSARIATGQYRNAYRVYKGAMTFAVITGGFVTAVVFFWRGIYRIRDYEGRDVRVRPAGSGALYSNRGVSWGVPGIFPGIRNDDAYGVFPDHRTDRQCNRQHCRRAYAAEIWPDHGFRHR